MYQYNTKKQHYIYHWHLRPFSSKNHIINSCVIKYLIIFIFYMYYCWVMFVYIGWHVRRNAVHIVYTCTCICYCWNKYILKLPPLTYAYSVDKQHTNIVLLLQWEAFFVYRFKSYSKHFPRLVIITTFIHFFLSLMSLLYIYNLYLYICYDFNWYMVWKWFIFY